MANAPPAEDESTFTYTSKDDGERIVLGLNPDDLSLIEIRDELTGEVLSSCPIEGLDSVYIQGGNKGDDFLTVDFTNAFWLRDGIRFEGGNAYFDSLAFIGNGKVGLDYTSIGKDAGLMKVRDGNAKLQIEFAGLEPVTVSGLASYTFNTSDASIFSGGSPANPGVDIILIDSPAAGQNRISGTSGGQAFENVTFFDVGNVIVNLGDNDTAGNDQDTVTISSDGLVASGLQNFSILTGEGDDRVVKM